MIRLLIIADDLTGAADAVAPLAGLARTSVVLDSHADWPDHALVAVDTHTRAAAQSIAADRVRAVAARALDQGRIVVKKVDSTLRGNVASEIAAVAGALADGGRPALAVVAPAFPATGRIVRDGVVLVHGQPVDDPYGGSIRAHLAAGGLSSVVVRADDRLPQAFTGAYDDGLATVVVDAESDADLAHVLTAAAACSRPYVLVGSGGLTRQYAARLRPEPLDLPTDPYGPTLVVVGSYSPMAQKQTARLRDRGVPHLTSDTPPAAADTAVHRSGAALLTPSAGPVIPAATKAIATELARTAATVSDVVRTLVLTGGDTARAVLEAYGVDRLQVQGELEPGVVWSVTDSGLTVITKAGAFGDADVLVRCLSRVRGWTP